MDYLAPFAERRELDLDRCALLVIDMQNASASRKHGLGRRLRETGREEDGAYRFDRIEQVVVPTLRRLLDAFRARQLQVVYLTMGSTLHDYRDMPSHVREFARWTNNREGEFEHEILADIAPVDGEPVINKITVGGFNSSSLDATLRALDVTDLLVCGVSTNSCVETTARDAMDRQYFTALVEDGCGAAQASFHEATLRSYQRLFGPVMAGDEVLDIVAGKVSGQR